MKRILAIALLGALIAGAVHAATDTPGAPAVQRNGYYWNATNGAKTDADGNAYTNEASKDRDYSSVTNVLTASTLAPGASAISGNSVEVGKYTSLMVMVSWNTAAAADSDSVAFGISFIGKVSSGTNDGFDFLFSPQDTASFVRADTVANTLAASIIPGIMSQPHTVYVISRLKSTDGGAAGSTARVGPFGNPGCYDLYAPNTSAMLATRARTYHVPMQRTIWSGGNNGVCFTLAAPYGATAKFSHLMVKVQNLNRLQTYTNIKVDVWPKVN